MTEIPKHYGEKPRTDFTAQWRRLLLAAECSTQYELAAVLGLADSSICRAKRRKNIPARWLGIVYEKKRGNPEWVRSGIGFCRLPAAEGEKGGGPVAAGSGDLHVLRDFSTDDLLAELVRRGFKRMGGHGRQT